jgi:F-type H+-transporting ATPase subunit b
MKKQFMLPLVVALILFLVPALAFASSEAKEPEGALETVLASPIMPNLAEFIPMFLAVGLLVWIMGAKVWPPIMKTLGDREAKIEGSLRSAEESKLEAEGILAQYQAKLEEGRKEAAVIIEEGRKSGEVVKADIIARAEADAAAIIEKAHLDAASKEKAVAASLQERTAALAISIASKILGEKLSADDQATAKKLAEIGG